MLIAELAAGAAFVAKKLARRHERQTGSRRTRRPPPRLLVRAPRPGRRGRRNADEAIADEADTPHPVTTPDDPAEVVDVETPVEHAPKNEVTVGDEDRRRAGMGGGLRLGLPGAYGAAYLTRHAEVWTFLGYPTYGGGPFESWGFPTLPMQMAFVLVCATALILGNLLWRAAGRPDPVAGVFQVEAFFWFGFALPFGFVLGAVRVALTVVRPTPA